MLNIKYPLSLIARFLYMASENIRRIPNVNKMISAEYFFLIIIIAGSILTPSYLVNFNVYNIKLYYAAIALGICLFFEGILFLTGNLSRINIKDLSFIISLVCGIEAVLNLLTSFDIPLSFKYTGHFDNVAGRVACLCPSLPFSLFLAKEKKWIGVFGKSISIIIVSAILCSGSRTGILCAIVIVLLFLSWHYRNQRYVKLGLILLLPIAIALYFVRPDSVNGRILILKSLLPMIKDVPFFGFGIYGFREKYMDYQATYLRENKDNLYSMLADNTIYPFNEFIHLYICFGIFGFIIFSTLIFFFFVGYKKTKGEGKYVSLLSMLSLCFLSLFSYPFNYPYSYIIITVAYGIIWGTKIKACLSKQSNILLSGVCIVVGICISIYSFNRIQAVYIWEKAYYERKYSTYRDANMVLNKNPYFLYNYSSFLFDSKKIDESLSIALKCSQLMSSYDLEVLLGEIYQEKGEFKTAEMHYQKAAYMCPCRFVPLYLMLRLYNLSGEYDKKIAIAYEILAKPIKVKSNTVTKIRIKAKEVLNYKDIKL